MTLKDPKPRFQYLRNGTTYRYDVIEILIGTYLEGPQTQISRSGRSLTLNISKMATDTAIVTTECE